jgi:hypothetical protein
MGRSKVRNWRVCGTHVVLRLDGVIRDEFPTVRAPHGHAEPARRSVLHSRLVVISNEVVHSGFLGKNGRYHTFRSVREETPSEASS